MKYEVFVSCKVSKMIEIEAEDEKEAERIANEKWNYLEIQFDVDEDYVANSFHVDFTVEE